MTDCAWTEERLPLLHYEDEALPVRERSAALKHLEGCEACRDALAALGAAAGALDAVPPADPARLREATAAVQAALGCRREADLVEGGDAVDRAHVDGCPVCRVAEVELAQLRKALDRVEAPALTDEQRLRLRAALEPQLTARPAGLLLRFGGQLGRAAAAALLAATVGLLGAGLTRADDPQVGMAFAGSMAVSGELDAAMARFAAIAERTETVPPRYRHLVQQAQREAEALAELNRPATDPARAKGTTAPPSREGAAHPEREESPYREVVIRYPDTVASLVALEHLLAQPGTATIPYEIMQPQQGLEAYARRHRGPGAREAVLRYGYDRLALWVDPKRVLDPKLRQAALLQRGLHAEALGEVLAARTCYEQAIAIDGGTPAADAARERLARLG